MKAEGERKRTLINTSPALTHDLTVLTWCLCKQRYRLIEMETELGKFNLHTQKGVSSDQLGLGSSREGNGTPLQCSCLENLRDGGAWWAAVSGVAQSRTRLKRLSSSRGGTSLCFIWEKLFVF